MTGRIGITVLWLLHFLPLRVLALVGRVAGVFAYALIAKRRHIARTNLRLCFPEMPENEREALLWRHFQAFGRALVESGIAWWGSPERLRRVVRIEGQEYVDALKGEPFVALVPHFVGIELEGMRMALDYRGAAVYVKQRDRYVDAFLKRKRERFAGTRLIARQEGVKAILRALRGGHALQLSPDMDLGRRDSVFVPFFGVPAATVTALSRIARLARARIVPLVIRQLPGAQGYIARFYPAWDNFPGDSLEEDARRMNAFIEARIREMPEQYLWTHRRFKTRPPGEPSLYARP
ncbi:MAG TPA: lipid A biosynthesis acyltransferase [Burkholderiales bacterium]|nr:lipid A biosynthesis acyltransferase [Burkholderiales bacterium]